MRAATRADFHDDELPVVAADEVELAEPAAIPACQNFKPMPLEVLRGTRLPEPAARERHSALADQAAGIDRLQTRRAERDGAAALKLGERQHAANAALRVER